MAKADRDARYQQSEKGRETQRRKKKKYRASQAGKEVTKKSVYTWVARNLEAFKKDRDEYRRSEHGKEIFRIKSHRYRSRKRNLPATLTLDEWKEILERQG